MKKLMTAAGMMLPATAAATATEVVIIRGSSNSECVVADPTGTPLNGCGSDPGIIQLSAACSPPPGRPCRDPR